jgi:signal peptidase I
MKFSKAYRLIVLVVSAGLACQWFYGGLYQIPSVSMQPLLYPGDVVWASGIAPIRRSDVMIFSFPEGDTVYERNTDVNYHEHKRYYGRAHCLRDTVELGRLVYVPIKSRQPYIKRCVGMPGDTLEVCPARLLINGQAIYGSGPCPVGEIQAAACSQDLLPETACTWKGDTPGAIQIPQKGLRVALNGCNLPFYARAIMTYEGNTLEIISNRIFINKIECSAYTFRQDYYFAVGDNYSDSKDSRVWGFVPADHLLGRAMMVFQPHATAGSASRWARLFRFM